jgi:hypothetical protein
MNLTSLQTPARQQLLHSLPGKEAIKLCNLNKEFKQLCQSDFEVWFQKIREDCSYYDKLDLDEITYENAFHQYRKCYNIIKKGRDGYFKYLNIGINQNIYSKYDIYPERYVISENYFVNSHILNYALRNYDLETIMFILNNVIKNVNVVVTLPYGNEITNRFRSALSDIFIDSMCKSNLYILKYLYKHYSILIKELICNNVVITYGRYASNETKLWLSLTFNIPLDQFNR